MAESQKLSLSQRIKSHPDPWLLAAFSIFYFADVCLRASGKFFWYDEIFTLYFCKIRTFHSLWVALGNGIDFNPPFFYLLTDASQHLFGSGQIGTRMPEIMAFWVFCLSLFRFVGRRAGALAGLIAMLLPVVTQTYYWAYEARPHGVVLGFCGLALICWQMATEKQRTARVWLLGLAASLLGAFMMHCFALTLLAPFALVEIYRSVRWKLFEWDVWLALLAPAFLSLPLYVPLLQSYKKLAAGTDLSQLSLVGWTQFEHFYFFLFKYSILVLLAIGLLFAVDIFRRPQEGFSFTKTSLPAVIQDLLLGFAFVLLPLFGIALGKITHGPFFNRYFLSSVAGISIVVGMGAGLRPRRPLVSIALSLVLLFATGVNSTRLVLARIQGRGEMLIRPDSELPMDTTPGQPLFYHPLLVSFRGSGPIGVISPFDFLYLVHYAPPALKKHLYLLTASTSSYAYGGFRRFLRYCPITFNPPVTFYQFLRQNSQTTVYGDPTDFKEVALLAQSGATIDSMQVVQGRFLARLSTKHK